MSHPNQTMIIENYRIRNFTAENVEEEDVTCLIQFLSSLDICQTCVKEIPKIQAAFGSDLDYQIDFESHTLDIHYNKKIVSGW
ncbi:MAG: hypothetical protein ACXADY_05365 [Candidatus Hodarchaeales archaeon]